MTALRTESVSFVPAGNQRQQRDDLVRLLSK